MRNVSLLPEFPIGLFFIHSFMLCGSLLFLIIISKQNKNKLPFLFPRCNRGAAPMPFRASPRGAAAPGTENRRPAPYLSHPLPRGGSDAAGGRRRAAGAAAMGRKERGERWAVAGGGRGGEGRPAGRAPAAESRGRAGRSALGCRGATWSLLRLCSQIRRSPRSAITTTRRRMRMKPPVRSRRRRCPPRRGSRWRRAAPKWTSTGRRTTGSRCP